ncbi:hypothetical protein F5Y16DRAFT_202779 [Xylariaceae sp. FL0255]|nr:hypothetical protein F5Y16DRAFT_202779 [Xylariaceae sp. FL0255]
MSFAGNLFTKLGLGDSSFASSRMSALLPQYISPPQRPVDEHDLAELSPRPEDALLADDPFNRRSSNSIYVNHTSSNAKVKASVTIQDPDRSPSRTGDDRYSYRAGKETYQKTQREPRRPSLRFPPEPRQSYGGNQGPQTSFFESMFAPRPTYADRTPPSKVDQTFKALERRERNMQKEIQSLLDAQDHALERHLAADDDHDDSISSQRSLTPEVAGSKGHIVPVRQPKKRRLSKREARAGILRCLTQLSNLKNEEEAYIATALAERKSALSRLRNLSSKRDNIVTEMKAIDSDRDRSFKGEIDALEQQHRAVCEDIENLEMKLRGLKHKKARLESKIAEAKSTRDSELSGYAGALKDCDKRIADIMNFPGIAVLEVESLLAQDADMKALIGDHLSGFEFLSLKPERRTLPMAKDWWEGELHILELRKIAVERDREALDEGAQLWQDILGRLEAHDQHLNVAMEAMGIYLKYSKKASEDERRQTEDILKKQYEMCKSIITDLEDLRKYTESQGWNPLVVSLTAELNYAMRLKSNLGETLRYVGWAEGIVTPQSSTPPPTTQRSSEDLLGAPGNTDGKANALVDDLTGSVIRRWDSVDEAGEDMNKGATTPPPPDAVADNTHEESDDNEVPPGLLVSEIHHESEDEEHNQIPPEFLSMHSPQSKRARSGTVKESGDATSAIAAGDDLEHTQGEDEGASLTRQDSLNEVPPDLLAESHPGDD